MNMLTSLKALFFSSTAPGKSSEGAGAASLPMLHVADFAELFSGSIADAALAQSATADPAQLAPPAETMPQFTAAPANAEPDNYAIWRHNEESFPPGLAPGANRAATLPSLHLPDAAPADAAPAEFAPVETSIDAESTDKADKPAPKDELIEDVIIPTAPASVPMAPVPMVPVSMAIVMEPLLTPQPDPRSAPAGAAGGMPVEPQADMLANPRIADISIPATKVRKGAAGLLSQPVDTAAAPEGPAHSTVPIANGKPIKSEALTLLQLVREQAAAGRFDAPQRTAEQVSTAVSTGHEGKSSAVDAPSISLSVPAPDAVAPPPTSSQLVASPLAVAPAPSTPIVDLSATLGAQVVDMGVSGQWIDGLARDIAGLSANGAQGRFQINTDQLGPVRVDIRQGSDGAAVHLTVATEAAELALRQDSDRLKLDASLSAVRIAEMKIDRAPVAEAARTETAGQQSSQQQSQHSSAHPQSSWANGSQDMSQPQGQQGRGQTRQNNGFDPKSPEDSAVLNHGPARQTADEAARARYA